MSVPPTPHLVRGLLMHPPLHDDLHQHRKYSLSYLNFLRYSFSLLLNTSLCENYVSMS